MRRLRPNLETEATAMRVVMEHERAQGRQVYDVSEKNLGYDITSLDLASGELRLIEVKGIGATDRHGPADAQRAARRRGPARLLLALRRHRLQHDAATAGADPRPGPPGLEQGDQGRALPHRHAGPELRTVANRQWITSMKINCESSAPHLSHRKASGGIPFGRNAHEFSRTYREGHGRAGSTIAAARWHSSAR